MPVLYTSTLLSLSLLHPPSNLNHNNNNNKHTSSNSFRSFSASAGNFFRMLKLLPALSSGCKMVALLNRSASKTNFLADHATTITLFGHRRGRVTLAIHEDTRSPPIFLIELPILTASFHKEMSSGVVKLALESETISQRKKLMEEYVWAVFCNGRKSGYSIRRKHSQASDDERQVMQLLRGVSMGAGVVPAEKENGVEGGMTYMRARFERVVGSKDSVALYMINPDGTGGPELSVFLIRVK
ncbi:protein MIZU-KUSSEI 1 [Phalaenopsis equestris]|uniref:protein MIZU-KUSSEI 1 n=1 Tax=Phalaenopsis equestris TaxID=78828 RepID=UPI0009E20988|nr:protein MIZU-KUSSEI 1 [Phalaenopsis equestris]